MPGAALFVYGTLTDPERVVAVTGRRFARRPARLDGYARIAPAGGYPYVVPRAGASVDGFVLDGLDADALGALDRYEDEGRLYVRTRVEIVVAGERVACETYVGALIARAPARG